MRQRWQDKMKSDLLPSHSICHMLFSPQLRDCSVVGPIPLFSLHSSSSPNADLKEYMWYNKWASQAIRRGSTPPYWNMVRKPQCLVGPHSNVFSGSFSSVSLEISWYSPHGKQATLLTHRSSPSQTHCCARHNWLMNSKCHLRSCCSEFAQCPMSESTIH